MYAPAEHTYFLLSKIFLDYGGFAPKVVYPSPNMSCQVREGRSSHEQFVFHYYATLALRMNKQLVQRKQQLDT